MISQPQNKNVSPIFYIFQQRYKVESVPVEILLCQCNKGRVEKFCNRFLFSWISLTIRYFFFSFSFFPFPIKFIECNRSVERNRVTRMVHAIVFNFQDLTNVRVFYFNHGFSILFRLWTDRKIECREGKREREREEKFFCKKKRLVSVLRICSRCSRGYF